MNFSKTVFVKNLNYRFIIYQYIYLCNKCDMASIMNECWCYADEIARPILVKHEFYNKPIALLHHLFLVNNIQ